MSVVVVAYALVVWFLVMAQEGPVPCCCGSFSLTFSNALLEGRGGGGYSTVPRFWEGVDWFGISHISVFRCCFFCSRHGFPFAYGEMGEVTHSRE